ncbi:MAG: histidine--tRNA ligase [candidate division NC10 bacterium]|jgi:histidyl-tRNA synthetase
MSEMKPIFKGVRGAPDILPGEVGRWQRVEAEARRILQDYGYQEIRTPIFERTELFVRGIGEGTDIVEKQMYTFEDRGKESLTLRPEGTAPVIRACLEHHLLTRGGLYKVYYTGPMFRHERPQAGRFRQFHQIGAEAIGVEDPALDAEVLDLLCHLFDTLGVSGWKLHLNSIGDEACRPVFREQFTRYVQAKKEKLCPDCRVRLERNPLRILDCKEEGCRSLVAQAPSPLESLCKDCKTHFHRLQELLGLLKIDYSVNEHLVRGLDYYTRTAFEFVNPALGAQNAIAGGGRYDRLVDEMGGPPMPGIGFAIGMERLLISLPQEEQGEMWIGVFAATLGKEASQLALQIVQGLRRQGVRASLDLEGRSLKSQMRLAHKERYRYTLILGDEELKTGLATLKDMAKGDQEQIPLREVVDRLVSQESRGRAE